MDFYLSAFADESSSDLAGQIDALKRNGCPYLEIRGISKTGNITGASAEEAKQIRHLLDDNGIQVWSLGSSIGKIPVDGDWAAHVELCKRALDNANILAEAMYAMAND